ncbi:aluminum-activated malate transporter 2 [Cajanus cajan]|uniref:aluminum-activated malate transporter 2 n=1 Tax=Cajanus cajan TaxID=3821 RepID=UPI00098DCB95|nr:aluminum-activated malate transporter 2 [Cajanus cajan]
MESQNTNQEKEGVVGRVLALPKVVKEKVLGISRLTKEIAKDDPRKVIHSIKVGLSISMVSLFYYYQPLYENFGLSAMWAVITVVVVFDYTVGATLGQGLNWTVGTFGAAALGFGAHHLASLSGATAEPILIGVFVFMLAAITSFIRFFPKAKARYDYGILIFIVTFSFISVSGFRDNEVLEMVHKRLSTTVIGGSACVMISIFICPVWAGEEFHYSIANKLEILGDYLEAFAHEYFKISKEGEFKDNKGDSTDKSVLEGYKNVLNSKSSDEYLVNFARWEPGHGKFKFRHPWDLYLQIGAISRECAYQMETLNAHLSFDVQGSSKIRCTIQELCLEMSLESSKVLQELGSSIKTMTMSSSSNTHVANAKVVVKSLKSLLQSSSSKEIDLLSLISIMTMTSLLIDIVEFIEKIADLVNDLATITHFHIDDTSKSPKPKSSQSPHYDCAESGNKTNNLQLIILVEESTLAVSESEKSIIV